MSCTIWRTIILYFITIKKNNVYENMSAFKHKDSIKLIKKQLFYKHLI